MNIDEFGYLLWWEQLAKEIKTFAEALQTSLRISRKLDNQVYPELLINGGNFSRMMKGLQSFPIDKLAHFCEIVGNDLPLVWLSAQRGYQMSEPREKRQAALKDLEEKVNAQAEMVEQLVKQIRGAKEIIGAKQE